MIRSRLLTIAAIAVLATTSCGAAPVTSADPTVASAEELIVHDSCGTSFTVRDAAGTTRLTISLGIDPATAVEPGMYELGTAGSGGGSLELGSGLDVWPCHDIANDFDNEEVQAKWTVTSGSIELLDPVLPDETGGGGSSAVRAMLNRVEIESGDGEVIVLEDVEMLNPRWGFYGG